MAGPLPKDPALRQRRNKAAGGATLSAEGADAPKRRVPPLPKIVVSGCPTADGKPTLYQWQPLTRAWWRDVWRSPMAAEYLQADLHGLYRLAILVDEFWREPDAKLAGEIRLQQQCFGLTPIDRRRLQWEVERVEEVTARKRRPQPSAPAASSPIDDPRALLRVVEGGKA